MERVPLINAVESSASDLERFGSHQYPERVFHISMKYQEVKVPASLGLSGEIGS
jgi:hypothetical protein